MDNLKEILDTLNPQLDNRIRKIVVEYLENAENKLKRQFYRRITDAFFCGAIMMIIFEVMAHFVWKIL